MIQLNNIAIQTEGVVSDVLALRSILIPLQFEFELSIPEANGLHWNLSDSSRFNDRLYSEDWLSGHYDKIEFCQPVSFTRKSNVQVFYGDGSDQLQLHFYKIDGTLISSQVLAIQDETILFDWDWQALGYTRTDIAYLEIEGANTGVRARSEPIHFLPDDQLLRLTYSNKKDLNKLGRFEGFNFEHIHYLPATAKPTSTEEIESYPDSSGNLFNTQTNYRELLNVETIALPAYMITIFSLAMACSILKIEGESVRRDGVLDRSPIERTDLTTVVQLLRLVDKNLQFNF